MAEALGDRYLFAFIVLNSNNIYGRPSPSSSRWLRSKLGRERSERSPK